MATVVFTMKDGTTRAVEGVTLSQVNQAWWRWTQGVGGTPVPILAGIDVLEVADITTRGTQAEFDANACVHVGKWEVVAP